MSLQHLNFIGDIVLLVVLVANMIVDYKHAKSFRELTEAQEKSRENFLKLLYKWLEEANKGGGK